MLKQKRAFGFIEILLVLVIISFLSYFILKTYLKKPNLNNDTQKVLTEEGIDSTNQKALLDSIKSKVGAINKQQAEREKAMEETINKSSSK
ncbi:MAG: type II secretion system protein [Candidatus Omnitrophota bacterium]